MQVLLQMWGTGKAETNVSASNAKTDMPACDCMSARTNMSGDNPVRNNTRTNNTNSNNTNSDNTRTNNTNSDDTVIYRTRSNYTTYNWGALI